MTSQSILSTVQFHRVMCPDDKRTDAELTEYYEGLVENSPFAPLVQAMEAEVSISEARFQRRLPL